MRRPRPGRAWPGWLVVIALTAPACGDGTDDAPAFDVVATSELPVGTEPVALAVLGDGDLLVGGRRTGDVLRVGAGGEVRERLVAHVDTVAAADDQRGLLGLAVDADDHVYGAWTRADDTRLVVADLTGGRQRLVWEGPPSSDLANGGHLAVLPDGRLLIGIGDLQAPEQTDDPLAPNGKLLALDPEGDADQRPTVLSGGWNNPFAFVVTESGAVWVADNAPGDQPERIGRGDRGAEAADAQDLPGRRAPSALVELTPGRLGLCGYLDDALTVVEVADAAADVGDEPAIEGCRTGAVSLPDGRIAVSAADTVSILQSMT